MPNRFGDSPVEDTPAVNRFGDTPIDESLLTLPGHTVPNSPHPDAVAPPTAMQVAHTAINALPAIGGMVGGMIGTPLPVAGNAAGALLGGAGGQATKQLIQRMLFPEEAPKTTGESLKNIAEEGGIQGLTEGIPRAAFGLASKVIGPAAKMVQGVVKPSKYIREQIPGAMQSILDEGVHTSDAARGVINDLNGQVANHVATHAQNGVTVPTKPLFDTVNMMRAKAAKNLDTKGLQEIEDYWKGLQSNPELVDVPGYKDPVTGQMIPPVMKTDIPVDVAHGMKVESGKSLPWGERGSYRDEARKAGVVALRDEISKAVPEVGEANGRIHNLLGAEDALTNMEGREGNKNPLFTLPIMLSMLGGAGAAGSGHYGLGAGALSLGALAKVLSHPSVALGGAQTANAIATRPAVQAAANAAVPNAIRAARQTLTN